MRNSRQLGSTIYNGITRKTALEPVGRNYATYRIQTRNPTESSPQSLEQNPVITLYRKNGSKVIQHGEVLEIFCDQPFESLEENSSDPQADDEKTKRFLALLKKIEDDAKNNK
jgi:hypothetical protein